MSLDEEYPKAQLKVRNPLRTLLKSDPGLQDTERREIAMGLGIVANNASDLVEIVGRLVNEQHSPAEVGELLIAFQLTLGQLLGASDLVNGKLYDIGDRLKEQGAKCER